MTSATGEKILRVIAGKLAMLSNLPEAGPRREELREGLRSFSVNSYILYYDFNTTDLRLVRVLHSARDIGPDLFEP